MEKVLTNYIQNIALCEAAKSGNLTDLKSSMAAGADPNYNNGAPLYLAALHNQLDCVKELVAAGANIAEQNYQCWNTAAQQGHSEVLRFLSSLYDLPMVERIRCVNEALIANQFQAAQVLAQQSANYLVSLISVAQKMGAYHKTIEFFETQKQQRK